jgi:hypothetical protein
VSPMGEALLKQHVQKLWANHDAKIIYICKIWGFHGSDYEEWRLLRSVRQLLLTASAVPSSPIFVTLIKEGLSSFETTVLTRATRRNIPVDAILNNIQLFIHIIL